MIEYRGYGEGAGVYCDFDGADGDQLFERGAPGGGAGEVDQMDDVFGALAVEVDVDQAGAFDFDGDFVVEG